MSPQMSRRNTKETELRVRISNIEKQKLMELAEQKSMSASELIRYLLRREWDSPSPTNSQ